MRLVSYIFILAIILLGTTFAILNSQSVTLNYYFGHRILPLSLLLVSVLVVGCLLGVLTSMWLVIKGKMQNYRLRQKLKLAEKEIENLRAIPLQDKH